MPATTADIGYNSKFGIHNGSVFVDVAEVMALTPPGYSRDAVEATTMQSPDKFREFIAGMMDAGESQIEINYLASVADVIEAAMVAGRGYFQVTHPSGVMMRFYAIVTNYSPSIPMDDRMTASATFKVTGKPTWHAAT